jgi:hypothetical protein
LDLGVPVNWTRKTATAVVTLLCDRLKAFLDAAEADRLLEGSPVVDPVPAGDGWIPSGRQIPTAGRTHVQAAIAAAPLTPLPVLRARLRARACVRSLALAASPAADQSQESQLRQAYVDTLKPLLEERELMPPPAARTLKCIGCNEVVDVGRRFTHGQITVVICTSCTSKVVDLGASRNRRWSEDMVRWPNIVMANLSALVQVGVGRTCPVCAAVAAAAAPEDPKVSFCASHLLPSITALESESSGEFGGGGGGGGDGGVQFGGGDATEG